MCLPYNIIFTNDSFHNIKGYFRPLSLFFHPFGVPISHPTLSQGFHFIPPLPLFFPPLRGSPCASRYVTGATFHSTPAFILSTPSGFPPMRRHIAVEIANPEGVARSQAGVQRSETPAEPTFPHHFEPRRGDRIIPFTPSVFIFDIGLSHTGVSFHSTPACDPFTPSGFPLRIPLCHRGSISFHPCLWSFHPFGVSPYAPTHRCGNREPRRGGKITGRGAAQRNPCGTDIPTPF